MNPAIVLKQWIRGQEAISQLATAKKILIVLRLAIFCLSLATILIYLGEILQNLAGYQGEHAVESFFENNSVAVVILFVGIIAPISEELIFRLPLDGRIGSIVVALITVFSMLTGSMIPGAILALIIFLLSRRGRLSYQLKFKGRQQIWLVLFSAMAFAFFHGYNFENIDQFWWLWPFLVLPQFIYGYVLGVIRLRFGFGYGVILHSLINLLASILAMASQRTSDQLSYYQSDGWVSILLVIVLIGWLYSVWNFFNIMLGLISRKVKIA